MSKVVFSILLLLQTICVLSKFTVPIKRMTKSGIASSIDAASIVNITEELEDFSDYQYYGTLTMGTPSKVYSIVFDTGSDLLWLTSTYCKSGCSGDGKEKFNCSASSTCYNTQSTNSIYYGMGDVKGFQAYDMGGFENAFSINTSVLLVYEEEQLGNLQAQGLMGLTNDETITTLVDQAYGAGYLGANLFTFHLDKVSGNSYLAFGYIPEEHVNDVTWLGVNNDQYWATDVIGMEINGQPLDISSDSDAGLALFDTGTSFIALCNTAYNQIHQTLRSAGCYNSGGNFICNCQTNNLHKYPNFTIYTRGLALNIEPHNYLIQPQGNQCVVALQTSLGNGMMILGDAFLRQNLVAYSKGNQTVGIFGNNIVLIPIPNTDFVVGLIAVILLIVGFIAITVLENKFKVGRGRNKTQPQLIEDDY